MDSISKFEETGHRQTGPVSEPATQVPRVGKPVGSEYSNGAAGIKIGGKRELEIAVAKPREVIGVGNPAAQPISAAGLNKYLRAACVGGRRGELPALGEPGGRPDRGGDTSAAPHTGAEGCVRRCGVNRAERIALGTRARFEPESR